jgi:hypothetical protein
VAKLNGHIPGEKIPVTTWVRLALIGVLSTGEWTKPRPW